MDEENTPEIPADVVKGPKAKKEKKKKGPKGPIRTGAVVPFILIVAAIVAFNILLLDSTIKKSLEFIGGKVINAEVNVGDVNTSFKALKISVKDMQFTDRKNPAYNKLQIGEIDFQLLWDAILRGKFVISLANVKDIMVNTKRTSPGEVYPVEIDEKTGNYKATQELLDKAEKEFEGNVFGDIAGVLGGGSTGDVSKNIEGSLESKKKFDAIQTGLKTKEQRLSADLKALPSAKDINNLQTRLKNIRWNDLGNIAKAPKVLKEADQLKKDIDKAIGSYAKVQKTVNQSLKDIDRDYKEAQALVNKDIQSVSKRMNLPTLDQASIAKMLFGNEVLDKVRAAKKYQTMAQKYMPPKKEKKAPVKIARKSGRDYQFGKPNSYPMFWLKLAKINSKTEQGTVAGKIENVTNDQNATGRLTTAQVKADFPPMNLRKIEANIKIDHRSDPKAMVDGKVGEFIVENKALSKSDDARFILKKSQAEAHFSGTLTPERADLKINNWFRKIKYDTGAKNAAVAEVLADVAKKNSTLTLDADVKGKWTALKFEIKSNLAAAINNSVRSLIQEKIEKVQAKIKADIEKQIAQSKAQVDAQIAKIKNDANAQINKAKQEIDKVKAQLNSQKKKAEKDAKKKLTNPLKKLKIKGLKL